MNCPYQVMRKGLCYSSTKKHHKKARFKKAYARKMKKMNKLFKAETNARTFSFEEVFNMSGLTMNDLLNAEDVEIES